MLVTKHTAKPSSKVRLKHLLNVKHVSHFSAMNAFNTILCTSQAKWLRIKAVSAKPRSDVPVATKSTVAKMKSDNTNDSLRLASVHLFHQLYKSGNKVSLLKNYSA